jgi:hypothetical protein
LHFSYHATQFMSSPTRRTGEQTSHGPLIGFLVFAAWLVNNGVASSRRPKATETYIKEYAE